MSMETHYPNLSHLNLNDMWTLHKLWKEPHTPYSVRTMLDILYGPLPEDITPVDIARLLVVGLTSVGMDAFDEFVKTMVK